MHKQTVILKITGNAFLDDTKKELDPSVINRVIKQIKKLRSQYRFCLVVGGGNFFRGHQHGKRLGLTPGKSHYVGMLSTMMNGLILKDLCEQQDIPTVLFSALHCPAIGHSIATNDIENALNKETLIVFAGGTGNPFVTTDTNAVIRSLQVGSTVVWKGTDVDGVYSSDPSQDKNAKLLQNVTYEHALQQHLGFMDRTALSLAQQYNQTVRVFNIFSTNALIRVSTENSFGSTVTE